MLRLKNIKQYIFVYFECLSKLSWINLCWEVLKLIKSGKLPREHIILGTTQATYPRGGFSCKEYHHWKHWCAIELAVLKERKLF